jgi:hypothetical protein
MRKLEDVIDAICEVVPGDENDLVLSLQDIKDSVLCAAPEMLGVWWREAAETLADYLPNESEECQKIVIAIWQDKYKEGKICL